MTTNTNIDITAKLRERARELAANPAPARRGATPKQCACGCGGWTKGGNFQPGHDAKLLARMIQEERAALAAAMAAAAQAESDEADATGGGSCTREEARAAAEAIDAEIAAQA